ncbi:hypothetical protein AALA54_02370 [Oscillospiraceae bacterium 44-34]
MASSDRRKAPSEPFIEDAHLFPDSRENRRSPPPGQDPRRRKSQQRRRSSVFRYIAVLFAAAFVLLLYTFMMERRQSQQQIDDLRQSASATRTLQGLLDENSLLKIKIDELGEQVKELKRQLAAAQADQSEAETQLQAQERAVQAMHWFWQIDEAYVRGRNKLCRELIQSLEDAGLQNDLPRENFTQNDRFSPYDRYLEIRGRLIK